jgi:hypothetical protein
MVDEMLRAVRLAADNDLEQRVRDVPGSESHAELVELRSDVNLMPGRTARRGRLPGTPPPTTLGEPSPNL